MRDYKQRGTYVRYLCCALEKRRSAYRHTVRYGIPYGRYLGLLDLSPSPDRTRPMSSVAVPGPGWAGGPALYSTVHSQ